MVQTYTALEGEYTVHGTDTATRSGASNAVAVVGGYDAANAAESVTAGEPTEVNGSTSARDIFGDSELARAAGVISANGVNDIHATPVGETSTTETFGSSTATSTFTLSNTPLFDPNVHPEHTVTITDVTNSEDIDVSYVYDTGSDLTQPSTDNAARLNPITGEVAVDTSSEYDVSYTYGDYTTAVENAVREPVRAVIVLTEAPSVISTLSSELTAVANDFDFKRGVVGATPEIASGDIAAYEPSVDDWRVIEVPPARGSTSSGRVRTAAAVGGSLASQPIGPDGSGLFDAVSGLDSLNTSYRPSDVKDFDRVTALTETATIGVADTTSTSTQFQAIYATEIIDTVGLGLFSVAREYAGGPQDSGDLQALLETTLQRYSSGSPPLLGFAGDRSENPYDVNVTLGADSSVADASVTIVPYPIAEEVNLSLTVSDGFVQFGGASA